MSKKNVTHHDLIDNIAAKRGIKRDAVYSLYEDFIDELLENLWKSPFLAAASLRFVTAPT